MKRGQKVTNPQELIGDKVLSFKEREKRSVEIATRIAESYPMVGGSSEDNLWRSLNQLSNRDLYILTQKRMQDIAFYLYDSNPLAKRIIEITRDFVIGDGFTYTAENEDILDLIDEFWNDPDNNLDVELDTNVLELGIFGELCLPVWVNSANGAVKLGYIDPATILKVEKDKKNPKISKVLKWKPLRATEEREYKIINIDKNLGSKSYGLLIGECFFFAINKVSGATRGRSDLLSLADWIDGHDQFLFARLERAFLLNTFIWDITCEGMNREDLIEFVKGLSMPKSGSIRAHNEKITWKSETPKLEASDASEEARMFKQQILGGSGFPEHWFGETSRTTRACYSEDTETLTENGWKKYWKIKKGEKLATFNPKKDKIEFHKPKGNIYLYDYEGEMYHFTNTRTDILVTPEHRMWIKEVHKERKFEIIQAKDITYKTFYIREGAKNWVGKKQEYFELPYIAYDIQSRIKDNPKKIRMSDWVEFLGWFLSEGVLNNAKNQYSVRISQKKPNNIPIIQNLLTKLGYIYHETIDKRSGVITFSLNNKSLWYYLKENVGSLSKEKRIPKKTLQLDKSYLQILFDAMMLGDGSWDKRKGRNCFDYATNSDQLADDFQILCLLLGYSSRQNISTKGKFQWNVITGSKTIERDLRNRICINNRKKEYASHIQKEQYKGKVYCFSLPYQFMITRRNGKIAIQLQTALETSLPTLKKLKSRQRIVKNFIKHIINFVIDQAIIHKRVGFKKDMDRSFKIIPSPIVSRDNKGLMESVGNFVDGLSKAVDKKWLNDTEAKRIFNTVLSQLGTDIESRDQEVSKEKEEPTNEET